MTYQVKSDRHFYEASSPNINGQINGIENIIKWNHNSFAHMVIIKFELLASYYICYYDYIAWFGDD